MPSVVQQWKDWYSGDHDPLPYVAGYGNFWLNTITKGVWEKVSVDTWVYRGKLTDDILGNGTKIFTFESSDWAGNRLTLIPTGVPVHGEIGPHLVPPRVIWSTVMALRGAYCEQVEPEIIFDFTTGRINIYKSALDPAFRGALEIRFSTS